jgi:hypothetical protein
MATIAIITLIAAVGSMSILNTNSNASAKKSSRHDHANNKMNDGRVCIYQRHVSVDQKHVCSDRKHGSSDYRQEEIILSSPGSPQQQFYLNHVPGGDS